LAQVALDVALVRPFKRRRLKLLAAENPEFIVKLEDTGLINAQGGWWIGVGPSQHIDPRRKVPKIIPCRMLRTFFLAAKR
jgi:hypothetical protein